MKRAVLVAVLCGATVGIGAKRCRGGGVKWRVEGLRGIGSFTLGLALFFRVAQNTAEKRMHGRGRSGKHSAFFEAKLALDTGLRGQASPDIIGIFGYILLADKVDPIFKLQIEHIPTVPNQFDLGIGKIKNRILMLIEAIYLGMKFKK